MTPSNRPSWPISGSDDYNQYHRDRRMDSMRYWSSPEGLGLTQEEFEALQEHNNPWPKSVRIAVDEVRTIANGMNSLADAEPEMIADRIAELVRPIVEYLEPLVDSLRLQQLEDKLRREDAAVESPWYFEPGIPPHVMKWESLWAFIESSESDANTEREERQVQSIESLLCAATSLAEIHGELDVAGIGLATRVVEFAEILLRVWELARHPHS